MALSQNKILALCLTALVVFSVFAVLTSTVETPQLFEEETLTGEDTGNVLPEVDIPLPEEELLEIEEMPETGEA